MKGPPLGRQVPVRVAAEVSVGVAVESVGERGGYEARAGN